MCEYVRQCVFERECVCVRERVCVCVCVCEREREESFVRINERETAIFQITEQRYFQTPKSNLIKKTLFVVIDANVRVKNLYFG